MAQNISILRKLSIFTARSLDILLQEWFGIGRLVEFLQFITNTCIMFEISRQVGETNSNFLVNNNPGSQKLPLLNTHLYAFYRMVRIITLSQTGPYKHIIKLKIIIMYNWFPCTICSRELEKNWKFLNFKCWSGGQGEQKLIVWWKIKFSMVEYLRCREVSVLSIQ